MKFNRLFTALICVILLFTEVTAQVTTQTFVYSGAIQNFTVPSGVTQLSVDARGAGGGSVTTCSASGGLGARMFGVITVTPGQVISILVGQAGGNSGSSGEGGGGGGSYVATGTVPLVVAGGGGGASSNIGSCGTFLNGVNASTNTAGTANASGVVSGGTGGNGGTGSGGSGGGGGGFYTNGTSPNANGGGRAFVNGGAGGFGTSSNGGFGGGGCGWSTGGNGGGGGGYSGGGTYGSSPYTGGGGGGSYNIGTNQINTAGFQAGNGLVILSYGVGSNSSGPLIGGSTALSFSFTGSSQNYTVPSCVNSITFDVQGAKGGNGNPTASSGGNGGRVTGVLTVTPGQVLQINVGGLGSNGLTTGFAPGGFNGGGAGAYSSGNYGGGGGGGATDIRLFPYSLNDRIVVAGGGGGGAYNYSNTNYDKGGNGGGTTGQAGFSGNVAGGTGPGGGGGPSSGGTAGFWSGYCTGTVGSFGTGGAAGTCANTGGGGGGGYYGGGGGVWSGGGGGSNYTSPSITNVLHTQGINTTSGLVNFTIGVNGAVVNSIVATPTAMCAGNSVTLSTGGLTSYTWSSASGNISNNSSVSVSPSVTSSYTVLATNSVGCVSGYSIQLYVNPLPTITVNSGTICAGQTFTMVPGGASTYTFAGGSNTVAPGSNNIYTVTGTSAVGCVAAVPAISSITVSPIPVISVNNGTVCTGSAYTIVPSGATSYTYSSGTNIVSPTSNTNYSVTGTGSTGCVSLPTPLTVSVSPLPTISVNSGSICSGRVFTITPSGAVNYSISSGGSGSTFTVSPNSNTNYLITGTSSVGCVSSVGALSSITVVAAPTIAVNNGTICSNAIYTINPTGASTYTFSSGSATVNPTSTTSYSITGTSASGCVSNNTAVCTVSVFITPTIAVNNGQICLGQVFTMTPSGANTYSYSNGSATVSPVSNATFNVVGTSIQGCISSNTVVSSVTVNPNPTITVNSGSICSGGSFTMIPSGAFTYTYTGGSPVVTPTTNAIYFISGTSAFGCVSANTAICTVTVYNTPVISVNSGTVCSGSVFTMVATGANSYTYSSGSPTVIPNVNSAYTVTGSSSQGCISNMVVSNVSVTSTPTIQVSGGSICLGASFTLVPNGANTYSFINGGPVVTPTITTSYSVSGTNTNGCSSAQAGVATVSVNAIPTLTMQTSLPVMCIGETAFISVSGASTYVWNNGANGPGISVSPTVPLTYSVVGTSVEGCTASAVFTQSVDPCTGLSEINDSQSLGFTLYPNPTSGKLKLLQGDKSTSNWGYEVYSALGKILLSNTRMSQDQEIDLSELPNGLYLINILQEGKPASYLRVVKQ